MELNLLKTAIEEKILRNIPAEIDKKFLNFLDEYKNFFSAIEENNLSYIKVQLKFYLPNRAFDTMLIIYPTNPAEVEINIFNGTLKDFAPSVRATIYVHTYSDIENKVKDFHKLGIGIMELGYTGNIYYTYIIQRLISLDKHFIMEYFL
jgi:6-pyruvoyl-tetrahydropterin synthase